MKKLKGIAAFIMFAMQLHAQEPAIIIPAFNDTYSDVVRRLEAGETDIDFQAFRFSFIDSEQFKIAGQRSHEFDSLKKEMRKLMKSSAYPEIIRTTKAMLSIDYTSLIAHKILRQTYRIIGDTVNAAKYKAIQFGLFNSILKNGDGKTCETAWPVINVTEEYFILDILGADLQQQSLITKGGPCDKMDVKVDGESRTYYFGVKKVFEGYKKGM